MSKDSPVLIMVFKVDQTNPMTFDLDWLWLIIPTAYFALSTLLLCFPPWPKHRYRNPSLNALIDNHTLLCIGHRGGGFQGPQNTMQLFKAKSSIQHMFQLDINQTKDQQLVVHHDATLHRTTGNSKNINQLHYEDLPPFLPEIEVFGKHGETIATENNKIALLDTLFQEFPRTLMNIELKTPTPTAVQEFARLMRLYKREDVTVWGAATDSGRKMLQEALPEVVTFYSGWEVAKIFLLCVSGLLPFWCIREGVLDIPLLTTGMIQMTEEMATSCGRKILVCLLVNLMRFFGLMSRLFVPHLRKRGILTFFWIVNDEEDWETAVNMGSRGIMTDCPSQLHQYLLRKNLFSPVPEVHKYEPPAASGASGSRPVLIPSSSSSSSPQDADDIL